MVYKCAVPYCKTGYNSVKKAEIASEENNSVFKFPKDTKLRNIWIKAIHRKTSDGKDWTAEDVKDHHRVCSLHFFDEDFITESQDQREGRKISRLTQHLMRKKLKPSAVPRIFHNRPTHLSKMPTVTRSSSSTADGRLQSENERISMLNESIIDLDRVSNVSDLIQKVKLEILPSGFVFVQRESSLLFMYTPSIDDFTLAPKLQLCIRVSNSLEISIYKDSIKMQPAMFRHLLCNDTGVGNTEPRITSVVSLLNILAFAKTTIKELGDDENSLACQKNAAVAIEELLNYSMNEIIVQNHSKKFIVEQLRLHNFKTCSSLFPFSYHNRFFVANEWKCTLQTIT